MYIPKQYQMHDFEEMVRFIEAHPFVTIVTMEGTRPIATHVPVNVDVEGEKIRLTGHLAKGNAQLETLVHNEAVLVLVQGPHAYISSTWYEKEDVPTWNYQSLHLYGKSRLLSPEELQADLKILLGKYEGNRSNGATWENLSEQTLKQVKGIIGFEIQVTEMQGSYKLSQTKTDIDKNTIITQLANSNHSIERQLSDEMKRHVLKNKNQD
ncbi:FMN-binding negative transcriptional regulator [Staphylococcus ratti]|uniref:FMN-binding negative transcriptional regulator n=1 Tax=Staphylococcus ratti TaxID=2892440 RepID=A0ABY3PDB4_9STAP|nr:FMN-binding negative transcriptional regulator [Staphylococcus ratti]UEX90282.1 FMN-binding negative transcriptional regulator [Staphylococcus ratti]